MKKIKYLLIGLLFLIPFKVKALTASMSITCSKSSGRVGEEISCTLNGYASGGSVNGIPTTISTSPGLTLTNLAKGSGWSGEASGTEISLYTDNNKTGSFVIATFTVKMNGNASTQETITVAGTEFSDENFNLTGVAGTSKTISLDQTVPPKADPKKEEKKEEIEEEILTKYLNNFQIKDVDFIFDEDIFEYYLGIPNEIKDLEFEYQLNDKETKAEIIGNKNLKVGLNTVILKLTLTGGKKIEYTF